MTHDEAYERLPALVGLRPADHEEAALRAHITSCPACAERLRALDRVARALADARETHDAPLGDLERRVLAIPEAHPARPAGRWRRRLVPVAVALATAAAVAALAVALLRPDTTPAPDRFLPEETVALAPVSGDVRATVLLGRPSGGMRTVRLDVRGLPDHGSSSFDLWFITASGAVRAGSFGPDPDGRCVVDLVVSGADRWTRIAITPSDSGPSRHVLATSPVSS